MCLCSWGPGRARVRSSIGNSSGRPSLPSLCPPQGSPSNFPLWWRGSSRDGGSWREEAGEAPGKSDEPGNGPTKNSGGPCPSGAGGAVGFPRDLQGHLQGLHPPTPVKRHQRNYYAEFGRVLKCPDAQRGADAARESSVRANTICLCVGSAVWGRVSGWRVRGAHAAFFRRATRPNLGALTSRCAQGALLWLWP